MNSKLKLILAGTLLVAAIGCGVFAGDNSGKPDSTNAATTSVGKTLYTCGMHPWIIQDHPGNCPICGMKLEPVHKTAGTETAASDARKILYYKSTMKAGETSPVPAKDSMGMEWCRFMKTRAARPQSRLTRRRFK